MRSAFWRKGSAYSAGAEKVTWGRSGWAAQTLFPLTARSIVLTATEPRTAFILKTIWLDILRSWVRQLSSRTATRSRFWCSPSGAVTRETWPPTTLTQAANTHCSTASGESPASRKTLGNRLVSPSIVPKPRSPLGVLYLRIIEGEVEVRAVVLGMALNTSDGDGHEAITLTGVVDMSAARAVTRFALNIGKLRSGIRGLESALFEADDVAFNASLIELLIAFFEGRHCVGVAGVFPDIVLLLMALRALVDARVRRCSTQEAHRRTGGLHLLGGLALLISEFGMGVRNYFGCRRVIGNRIVEGDIAIGLVLDLAVVREINSEFAEVL